MHSKSSRIAGRAAVTRLRRPQARRRWAIVLAVAASALLAACAAPEEPEPAPLGAGAGGQAVNSGTVVTADIATPGGVRYGSLEYDAGYFTLAETGTGEDALLYVFLNVADALGIIVNRIGGRPDTPCRFTAALQARDTDYLLAGSADVLSEQGLEFHRVDLEGPDSYLRYYCVTLRDNLGVQVTIQSDGSKGVGYEQVHHLLNSVRLVE